MNIETAQKRVAVAATELDAAVNAEIDQMEKVDLSKTTYAQRSVAIKICTTMVRDMLLQNLRASGIKSRSQRLEGAVGNAEVFLMKGRNGLKIAVGFKSGLPNDRQAKSASKKSVYVYGAALNYGAVRGAPGIKAAGKARIKRAILKKTKDTGGRSLYDAGVYSARAGKHFFQLTGAQTQQVASAFNAALIAVRNSERN